MGGGIEQKRERTRGQGQPCGVGEGGWVEVEDYMGINSNGKIQ